MHWASWSLQDQKAASWSSMADPLFLWPSLVLAAWLFSLRGINGSKKAKPISSSLKYHMCPNNFCMAPSATPLLILEYFWSLSRNFRPFSGVESSYGSREPGLDVAPCNDKAKEFMKSILLLLWPWIICHLPLPNRTSRSWSYTAGVPSIVLFEVLLELGSKLFQEARHPRRWWSDGNSR